MFPLHKSRFFDKSRSLRTAYHSQANGLIERLHRQLKASLVSANVSRWTGAIQLVLLGIRSVVKADVEYTAHNSFTERHPEFQDNLCIFQILQWLKSNLSRFTNSMRSAKPVSTRPQSTDIFVQPTLHSSHIFYVPVHYDELSKWHMNGALKSFITNLNTRLSTKRC